MEAKPGGEVQPLQSPQLPAVEKPEAGAVPAESISMGALKALLDGRGVIRRTGDTSAGETGASEKEDTSDKKPHPGKGHSGTP